MLDQRLQNNFKEIIDDVYKNVKSSDDKGELASYIPELKNVNEDHFGVCLTTNEQKQYGVGDFEKRFSIQSISKVLSLSLAYQLHGGDLWKRVGVEPSGTPFNSLVQLEADRGIPRNPFMNAGALVICDVLLSSLKNPKKDFIDFVRSLANNESIDYSAKIAQSEKTTGFRNISLCNLIKDFGNLDNNPNDVLDFYFDLCSVEMSCKELSEVFLFLANGGKTTHLQKPVLTKERSKRINALMQTCGFYDESGEFAFKVGLPGKSGVGGGIIAVLPNQYSIAVWSPKLNPKGNSYKGMLFLEKFTTETKLSIF